jgi:hypothetical protein
MDADQLAASGTGPFFLFTPDKASYARSLDVLEILDHAHAIFGSITLVQIAQPGAGESVTRKTVTGSSLCPLHTGLDKA